MTEASRTAYYDLPATPEHLEAVGRIAAAWSYLESVVEAAIWSLCVYDESRGRALTTHMNLENAAGLVGDATSHLEQR